MDLDMARLVDLDYTNDKGHRGTRLIRPTGRMVPGDPKFHPGVPWVIEAYDCAKGAMRTFDPAHIHGWTPRANQRQRSLDEIIADLDRPRDAVAYEADVTQEGLSAVRTRVDELRPNRKVISCCARCQTPLDQPGRRWTDDCGGDCVACMADMGDPDCVAAMSALTDTSARAGVVAAGDLRPGSGYVIGQTDDAVFVHSNHGDDVPDWTLRLTGEWEDRSIALALISRDLAKGEVSRTLSGQQPAPATPAQGADLRAAGLSAPEARTCAKCGITAVAFICSERDCPENGGAAYPWTPNTQSEFSEAEVGAAAAVLDHPSVYMGGPSERSKRLARAALEAAARVRPDQGGEPKVRGAANMDDATVDRIMRAIDPIGCAWIDIASKSQPDHPALKITQKRLMDQAKAAIRAMQPQAETKGGDAK